MSAWLFHSTLYVMVALTLQSDPSGHSQLSHVPAADKQFSCDSEEQTYRSQAMPHGRVSVTSAGQVDPHRFTRPLTFQQLLVGANI